jgi:hypothetical protein
MIEYTGDLFQSAVSMSSLVLTAAWATKRSDGTSAQAYFERQHAISQLEEFSDLEDGWAGPGSLAPTKQILETAKSIALVPGFVSLLPDISAMPNGTIAFDWETEEGSANLEIGVDSFSFYLDRDGSFFPLSGSSRMIPAFQVGQIISQVLTPVRVITHTRPVSYSDTVRSVAPAYA